MLLDHAHARAWFRVAILAASVTSALATRDAVSAEPEAVHTRIPGTRVSLVIPDGFVLAKRYPGLVRDDVMSSVLVNEIPGPFETIRQAMTKDALAERGMQLLRSEDVRVDGCDGVMLHVKEEVGAETVLRRSIVIFGRGDATVMLAASTPQSLEDRLGRVLRKTVMGAKWEPAMVLDPYDGLGFTASETGSLKVSDRVANMISFTRGGQRGRLAPVDPVFIIGSSFNLVGVTDLQDFARRRLLETAGVRDLEVLEERALEVDGLTGYEFVAAAIDRATDTPLRVYQVIAVEGTRYFAFQGLVGAENADEFIPEFRTIVGSFRRTD